MNTIKYNDNVTLAYEHVPIQGSGNAIVDTSYYTEVILVTDNGWKYYLGRIDGKPAEQEITDEFKAIIEGHKYKQYSRPSTFLRKNLTPIRKRKSLGLWQT